MSHTAISLTVLFEDPFWVGLFEREGGGRYEVCKVTFGAEPKDYEVYAYILSHWHRLVFSPAIPSEEPEKRRINPKRRQRQIERQTVSRGVGTKAQQALKLQHEACKTQRRIITREMKEAEKERQFSRRQEKRRQKHRGH